MRRSYVYLLLVVFSVVNFTLHWETSKSFLWKVSVNFTSSSPNINNVEDPTSGKMGMYHLYPYTFKTGWAARYFPFSLHKTAVQQVLNLSSVKEKEANGIYTLHFVKKHQQISTVSSLKDSRVFLKVTNKFPHFLNKSPQGIRESQKTVPFISTSIHNSVQPSQSQLSITTLPDHNQTFNSIVDLRRALGRSETLARQGTDNAIPTLAHTDASPWMLDERLPILQERLETARQSCLRHAQQLRGTHRYWDLLLDPTHHLGWCRNAKVATSTIIAYLLELNGWNIISANENIPIHSRIKKVLPSKKELSQEFLDNLLLFTMVRHPFQRLVSAYRDKVLNNNYFLKKPFSALWTNKNKTTREIIDINVPGTLLKRWNQFSNSNKNKSIDLLKNSNHFDAFRLPNDTLGYINTAFQSNDLALPIISNVSNQLSSHVNDTAPAHSRHTRQVNDTAPPQPRDSRRVNGTALPHSKQAPHANDTAPPHPRDARYVNDTAPPHPRDARYVNDTAPPHPRDARYVNDTAPPHPRDARYVNDTAPPHPRDARYVNDTAPPHPRDARYVNDTAPTLSTSAPQFSFREFIVFTSVEVLRCGYRPQCWESLDVHFRPQVFRCNPCALNFDLIFKLETFDEDMAFLKRVLNLPSIEARLVEHAKELSSKLVQGDTLLATESILSTESKRISDVDGSVYTIQGDGGDTVVKHSAGHLADNSKDTPFARINWSMSKGMDSQAILDGLTQEERDLFYTAYYYDFVTFGYDRGWAE